MIAHDVVSCEEYVDGSVPHNSQHRGLDKLSHATGRYKIKLQFSLLSQ